MSIYVIISNYFPNGVFGVYSTVKRARIVLERYFAEDNNIVAFEDIDNYSYQFTNVSGITRLTVA